jgi:hypothetical protein
MVFHVPFAIHWTVNVNAVSRIFPRINPFGEHDPMVGALRGRATETCHPKLDSGFHFGEVGLAMFLGGEAVRYDCDAFDIELCPLLWPTTAFVTPKGRSARLHSIVAWSFSVVRRGQDGASACEDGRFCRNRRSEDVNGSSREDQEVSHPKCAG